MFFFVFFLKFPSCNSQLASWKFNFEDRQKSHRPHSLTRGPQGGAGGPQFEIPVGTVNNSVLRKSTALKKEGGTKGTWTWPQAFASVASRGDVAGPPIGPHGGKESSGGSFSVAPALCLGGWWGRGSSPLGDGLEVGGSTVPKGTSPLFLWTLSCRRRRANTTPRATARRDFTSGGLTHQPWKDCSRQPSAVLRVGGQNSWEPDAGNFSGLHAKLFLIPSSEEKQFFFCLFFRF